MLSLTTWGGLPAPCARTGGACIAQASPRAELMAEAANRRLFMSNLFGFRLGARLTMVRFGMTVGKVTAPSRNSLSGRGHERVCAVARSRSRCGRDDWFRFGV